MGVANLLFAPPTVKPNCSSLADKSTTKNRVSFICGTRHYPVLKTGSHRLITPVMASKRAINMMRMVTGKEDEEIKDALDKCQNTWANARQFLVDVFSVIAASNPYLRCITELLNPKDFCSCITHAVAICGTSSALVECLNYILFRQIYIFYNISPPLEIIAIGYAIYKTTLWNYSLLKKGRNPIWTPVIIALHAAKIFFDIITVGQFRNLSLLKFAVVTMNPLGSAILALLYIEEMRRCKIQRKT